MAEEVSGGRLLATERHDIRCAIKRRWVGQAVNVAGELEGGTEATAYAVGNDQAAMVSKAFRRGQLKALVLDHGGAVGRVCRLVSGSVVHADPKDPIARRHGVTGELHLIESVMEDGDSGQVTSGSSDREEDQGRGDWRG